MGHFVGASVVTALFGIASIIQICTAAYAVSLFFAYRFSDKIQYGFSAVDMILVVYQGSLTIFFAKKPTELGWLVASAIYNLIGFILMLVGNDPAVSIFWHGASLPVAVFVATYTFASTQFLPRTQD